MGGKKGGYGNSESHHRQGKMGDLEQARSSAIWATLGDGVGPATVGGTAGAHRWRALLVLLLVVLVGFLLLLTPLAGIGAFLVIGSMIAMPVITLRAWWGA